MTKNGVVSKENFKRWYFMSCYECKFCRIEPLSSNINGIDILVPVCAYPGINLAFDGYCAHFEKSNIKDGDMNTQQMIKEIDIL